MSLVYLIGRPVAHSLSPAIHEAAFAALGLPHRYLALDVADDALRAACGRLRDEDALGANVTIPHKERVVRYLDDVSDEARRIGAVNTIVRRASRLHGENTDLFGFEAALSESKVDLSGSSVLVLGAGGAARACVLSLLRGGSRVRVANRTRDRAQALAAAVVDEAGRRAEVADWPDESALRRVDAIVNATPLGIGGEDPLDGLPLRPGTRVVDLVPTAHETPLIRRARAECIVVDGLLMLLHQAARSFTLWTGLDAPVAVMRAALPRLV